MQATPISTSEPGAGRHVRQHRQGDEHQGRSTLPAKQRGDGDDAERERQRARIEVRLDGVGAGSRDAVSQCDRGAERSVAIGERSSCPHQDNGGPEQRRGDQVADEEDGLEREAGLSHHQRDGVVEQHEAPLGVDEGGVAGKRRGVSARTTAGT